MRRCADLGELRAKLAAAQSQLAKYRLAVAQFDPGTTGRLAGQLSGLHGNVKYWTAEVERHRGAIAEAEALMPEYQVLLEDRPDGCLCLGLGGWGAMIAPRGTRFWEHWCTCPEAKRYHLEWEKGQRLTEQQYAEIEARKQAQDEHFERRERMKSARIPDHFSTFTFESFRALTGLDLKQDALELVEAFAERNIKGDGKRSIFLYGPAGSGKSGISVACLRRWIERGERGVYVSVPSFFRVLKSSFDHRDDPSALKPSQIIKPLGEAGLLVMDDLGGEQPTAYARNTLLELIGYRHDERLPTIFTSNFDLGATASRLLEAGGDPVESDRIVYRIAEMAVVQEMAGRNLRDGAL